MSNPKFIYSTSTSLPPPRPVPAFDDDDDDEDEEVQEIEYNIDNRKKQSSWKNSAAVPLGIFGGAVALAALMVFSRKKEGNMSQKVMQARVAVQALVVAGLGGGAIYANMSRKTTSDIHDK